MLPRELSLLVLVALPILYGCSDQGVCTAEARPAVAVEVRDASSGEFLAEIARGEMRDGPFQDSLRVVAWIGGDPALATTLGGAYERPGTYSVFLEADGWQPWDTSGIVVTSDGCHVQTAAFTAQLERTS